MNLTERHDLSRDEVKSPFLDNLDFLTLVETAEEREAEEKQK